MLGVAFTLLISFPLEQWMGLKYFFIALAVMFITGLRDDILTLSPSRKLFGQILPIVILAVFGKVTLNSFYEVSPIAFPDWLSWIITVFTLVILTNSYNLIDGLDGLAGTIAVIILTFFGCWFFSVDDLYLSIIAFSFASSIIAFLLFNWQPSKIFMGDTGTLAIGFVISFLSIRFINQNFSITTEDSFQFQSSISTALCVLIIPVFDTTRVIILRMRNLQSPFKADRNHLHHQFIAIGFSHSQTTLTIAGINLFFIGLAFLLRSQPDKVILPIIALICIFINQVLKIVKKR